MRHVQAVVLDIAHVVGISSEMGADEERCGYQMDQMPYLKESCEWFLVYSHVSESSSCCLSRSGAPLARESNTSGMDSSLCITTERWSESTAVSDYPPHRCRYTHSCSCSQTAAPHRHVRGLGCWCEAESGNSAHELALSSSLIHRAMVAHIFHGLEKAHLARVGILHLVACPRGQHQDEIVVLAPVRPRLELLAELITISCDPIRTSAFILTVSYPRWKTPFRLDSFSVHRSRFQRYGASPTIGILPNLLR